MKLADLPAAAALAAERETLMTLSASADVTVEVNQKNRHAFTFNDATAKVVFSNRLAAINAALTALGVILA